MDLLSCLRRVSMLMTVLSVGACAYAAPSITIRNNHSVPYHGPVTFQTKLPDGCYKGRGAVAEVTGGTAYVVTDLPGRAERRLRLEGPCQPTTTLSAGALSALPGANGLRISYQGREVGMLDFGLALIPGDKGEAGGAVSSYKPLELRFSQASDGMLSAKGASDGYEVSISLKPYGGGWVDVDAHVNRTTSGSEPAYLALIRRITTPGAADMRVRWNGQVSEPDKLKPGETRDYSMAHGTEWCSWKASGADLCAVNGFSAGYAIEQKPGRWVNTNRYYVQERADRKGDSIFLISEMAGPDVQGLARKTAGGYFQPRQNEPIHLYWRLAVATNPRSDWQHSHLLCFAGYREVTESGESAVVDLGAPFVEFGTSYFPYSTMCENFDFYRTKGQDREGWWPFSPDMWEKWREFRPQMETDLRICKAMGFDWVRLHHLELLGTMDRGNALAFLDFYMDTCRILGLKVLIDTSGSTSWFKTLARRYGDVAQRFEIENEILIPGISPGAPERWTACYNAVKEVAPDIPVYLTGCCNQDAFDRLIRLGVPFDIAGNHYYKHRAGSEEVLPSVALAAAGYATSIGRRTNFSEFNWKFLTDWAPEARAAEWALIFRSFHEPRAVPEFSQFHWQETLSVNPRLTRQGLRHYETIYLDRRPKPEAIEFMKLMREYARPDSPVRVLPITIGETTFRNGRARARFTIENRTGKTISLKLSPEAFGDVQATLQSEPTVTLRPKARAEGMIDVSLNAGALPGTYHYFLRADYPGGPAYGWGIAANHGAPKFDANLVLPELVEYPQGASVVEKMDWSRTACVAFGKGAPILEIEMAYQVYNTLQCATGRKMRLCSTADIPKSMLDKGSLVLVGTAATNPLIAQTGQKATEGKGTVLLHDAGNGRQWLLLMGDKPETVEAASVDFTLRYWKNAKDSSMRISGLDKGAALGNKAAPGQVNPP